jgi:succinate dehydrogenase / fumarate reductase flavoprotein subunit
MKNARKAQLAPRDVVSRSMIREIQEGRGIVHESGADCLTLDLTHLGEETIKSKLAGIREIGIKFSGVDIVKEPIQIRPVCHYMMGGIHTNIDGSTEISGLWAATHPLIKYMVLIAGQFYTECLVGRITGKLMVICIEQRQSIYQWRAGPQRRKKSHDGIFRGEARLTPH